MIISHYARAWILLLTILIAMLLIQGLVPAKNVVFIVESSVSSVLFWYIICNVFRCGRSPSSEEERTVDGPGVEDIASRLISHPTSSTRTRSLEVDPPSQQLDDDDRGDDGRGHGHGRRDRIHYLDSVKIFLTALVVNHHVACAFGSGGVDSWYIIVGLPQKVDGGGTIHGLLGCLTLWDQGYFMSLFFFISAYLTPGGYERKGRRWFHHDRAKRYGLPLLFVTYGLYPLTAYAGCRFCGVEKCSYGPHAGVAWFLLWLILLNMAYSFVEEAYRKDQRRVAVSATDGVRGDDDDEGGEENDGTSFSIPLPRLRCDLPGFGVRWGVGGVLVCGLLTFVLFRILHGTGNFVSMPVTIGSLPCDLFAFALGIVAYHNRWLETSLREQIGSCPDVRLLRVGVAVEALVVLALLGVVMSSEGGTLSLLIFSLASGVYCVDTVLVVLELFQTHADGAPGPLRSAAAEAAYAVYLVHPLVVTLTTMVFVHVYNLVFLDSKIEFVANTTRSYSQLVGPDDGGLVLVVGWVIVSVSSQLILWPLGYCLKRLPGLRSVI